MPLTAAALAGCALKQQSHPAGTYTGAISEAMSSYNSCHWFHCQALLCPLDSTTMPPTFFRTQKTTPVIPQLHAAMTTTPST